MFLFIKKQCRGQVVCLVAVYIVFNISLSVKMGGVGAIEVLPIREKKGGGGSYVGFFLTIRKKRGGEGLAMLMRETQKVLG